MNAYENGTIEGLFEDEVPRHLIFEREYIALQIQSYGIAPCGR